MLMKIPDSSLSGLLSRERCLNLANYLVANAKPSSIAALWLNLDRFNQINSSFGYAAGDATLSIIAERLGNAVCDDVNLGHMGADEFVCLSPIEKSKVPASLAQLIVKTVEEPIELSGMIIRPSARVGIATLLAGESATSLLQRADHAMRLAKSGNTRWCHARTTEAPAQIARSELSVESKLHRAIETGGLSLHYQPIVNLDGRVEAVEALMRCSVDGQYIPPSEFIPVAEKTGLITRLGEWALMQAALFARQLADMGFPLRVAVNVSRIRLLSTDFSRTLHSALVYSRLPPQQLELDLTESMFTDPSDVVQENIRSARAIGVSLAIDDFGSGRSCLISLRDIHASKLKLAPAFTANLPDNPRALSIAKTIATLGRELGMTVVAKGVENDLQMQALRQTGIDAVQGYVHAVAVSAQELLAWLSTQHRVALPENTTLLTLGISEFTPSKFWI